MTVYDRRQTRCYRKRPACLPPNRSAPIFHAKSDEMVCKSALVSLRTSSKSIASTMVCRYSCSLFLIINNSCSHIILYLCLTLGYLTGIRHFRRRHRSGDGEWRQESINSIARFGGCCLRDDQFSGMGPAFLRIWDVNMYLGFPIWDMDDG